MDYKKKYEELYERISNLVRDYDCVSGLIDVREELKSILNESQESEDERIRKGLIHYFSEQDGILTAINGNVSTKDVLTWLKKQGEQKPTDEIEPKFKVGDYIVGKHVSGYISEISEGCYLLGYQGFPVYEQDNYHLWTIQDAKDGDVLTTDTWTFIFKKYQDKSVYYHCAASVFNDFAITDTGEFDSNYVHPATKEQRGLLFSKMKEAGYEWDAEKKELKRIEQKSDWSEEDERHLSIAIQYVFEHGYLSTVDWLKSLKERYSWKPSKEQMETIQEILTVDCPPNFRKRVESLYTDIKKL